jgi:N-methylhydantoinase A
MPPAADSAAIRSPVSVGVDVGGTFTDCILVDPAQGRLRVAKVPSTLEDQSLGAVAGIDVLHDGGPWRVDLLVHGTTVATNAVIERSGADVALVTSRGFRDVLELRRRDRPDLFGLGGSHRPLVPRHRVFEIAERVGPDGEIEEAPDPEALAALAAEVAASGAGEVVVSLLNAYANPANEEATASELERRLGDGVHVVRATAVVGEYREFERTATATTDAYVHPLVSRYLNALGSRVAERGFEEDVWVSQSNGGRMSLAVAAETPVKTVLSGPAAGVVAGQRLALAAGRGDAVTMDMGGTSLDVGLSVGGAIAMADERTIEFGLPVRLPMVDVATVGAGGGSIARIDAQGLLAVGPESAGAVPGPACYGKGGVRPTLTDANVVLGRLGDGGGLGSERSVAVDRGLAEAALLGELGALGGDAEELAAAVVEVAVHTIADSLRLATIERGLDPERFALVCFGGAGPMHVTDVLRRLPFAEAIVPRFPGITSALGCLLNDARHDFSQTVDRRLYELGEEGLTEIVAAQAESGRALLAREGLDAGAAALEVTAELRYPGQTHSIAVALDPGSLGPAAVLAAFEDAYRRRFGRVFAEREPIVTAVRTATISAETSLPVASLVEAAGPLPGDAATETGERAILEAGEPISYRVYDRELLRPGEELSGPAVVEQSDSTTLIHPGFAASVDEHHNLRIAAEGTMA